MNNYLYSVGCHLLIVALVMSFDLALIDVGLLLFKRIDSESTLELGFYDFKSESIRLNKSNPTSIKARTKNITKATIRRWQVIYY